MRCDWCGEERGRTLALEGTKCRFCPTCWREVNAQFEELDDEGEDALIEFVMHELGKPVAERVTGSVDERAEPEATEPRQNEQLIEFAPATAIGSQDSESKGGENQMSKQIREIHMPRTGKKRILFVGETEQGNDEEHPVKCLDEPLPGMYKAMDFFVPFVLASCELPKGFASNVTVRTVLITERNEGTSVTLTFVKELKDGRKLVWTAPQKAIEDDSIVMGILKKVRAEAMKWYNGKRLQVGLLPDAEEKTEAAGA